MDKQTLSNYGWIVICTLVLAVMLALATPFGEFIGGAFRATFEGFGNVTDNALAVIGIGNGGNGGSGEEGGETPDDGNTSISYSIIEKPETAIDASADALFRSDADYLKFMRVKVDGEAVEPEHYDLREGSTIVELKKEYLATLSVGTHTLTIVSSDGEASCEFEICAQNLNLIPVGGTYTCDDGTVLVGDGVSVEFPETVNVGDAYVYGDYKYKYDDYVNGWIVEVRNSNQTEYGAILENINGQNVTDITGLFTGCVDLVIAPAIPNSVTDMNSAFFGCSSLKVAPIIPSNVVVIDNAFFGCSSLTGTITINANPTTYGNCFSMVDFQAQQITLTGSCSDATLDQIGATGENYCANCNGACHEVIETKVSAFTVKYEAGCMVIEGAENATSFNMTATVGGNNINETFNGHTYNFYQIQGSRPATNFTPTVTYTFIGMADGLENSDPVTLTITFDEVKADLAAHPEAYQ